MRILIVSHDYPSTANLSARAFVHARVSIYIRKGNSAKVFVPSPKGSYTYTYEDVDVIRSPLGEVFSIVEDFDPDVVAVHSPTWRWLSTISKLDRPVVSWIHGAEALVRAFHNHFFPFSLRDNILKAHSILFDPVKRTLLRECLQASTAVVYVSEWLKKTAENYTLLRHPKSYVVPNPIDVNFFKQTNKSFSSRISKAISARPLQWKNGLDIAIEAYSNLKETGLVIRGKGPMEKYLKKVAEICNSNVEFETEWIPRDQLPLMYNDFGYFVAPSRTESQGVAMCEAMACGLPVIATRVGGIPEFVSDGFNGLTVPPEKPLKLRKAVKLLILNDELHARLSENARRFVIEHLSHEIIYSKEMKVFKRAL